MYQNSACRVNEVCLWAREAPGDQSSVDKHKRLYFTLHFTLIYNDTNDFAVFIEKQKDYETECVTSKDVIVAL